MTAGCMALIHTLSCTGEGLLLRDGGNTNSSISGQREATVHQQNSIFPGIYYSGNADQLFMEISTDVRHRSK